MKITQNCFVPAMPDKDYHSDPTPDLQGFAESASLSSSTLIDITTLTELKAKMRNRRLNPAYQRKKSEEIDLGEVAHDYILRGETKTYEVAPYDAWRSNDAKAARDRIEAKGLIALNETTAPRVADKIKVMKTELFGQLAVHKDFPGIMTKGNAEVSGFAFDGQIWNRIKIDWLDQTYPDLIVDYKTTGLSFDKWQKNELWGDSAKFLQYCHYRRVYKLVTGKDAKFVFVVQQTFEPYDVVVITPDTGFTEDMQKRYDWGYQKFLNCLKTGQWNRETPYTVHSYPPTWVLQQWELDAINREVVEKNESAAPDVRMAG